MADPVDEIPFIPNEFYELKYRPAVQDHPHEALIRFKIAMVAWTTVDSVCFAWPSITSLAYFYKYKADVLPLLDQQCILTRFEAVRIVERQLNFADLCIKRACRENTWLLETEDLHQTMGMIPVEHTDYIQRTRVRTGHFYEVTVDGFPTDIAVGPTGFARVAWVTGQTEGPNPTVEVRIPSMASLAEFERSESLALPVFDQVFTISIESARSYLRQLLPIELIMQLRRHRDFWINHVMESFHNLLLSTLRAGAGVDARNAGEGTSAARDAAEEA